MSIFKKLTSFLFEETDADIIAEDELEEVTLKTKKEKPIKQEPLKETVPPKVDEAEAFHTAKPETKKFVSIDLETKKEVVKEEKNIKETVVKPRSVLKKDEKKEYEFTPVISPIFGAKEETVKVTGNNQKSITIPRAVGKRKENPLGTIISPYYGVNELEAFEEEAKKDIEEKAKSKQEDIVMKEDHSELKEEALQEEMLQYVEEEEEHALPLEAILAEDEKESEDLLQISLFGDSTPIKEAESNSNESEK